MTTTYGERKFVVFVPLLFGGHPPPGLPMELFMAMAAHSVTAACRAHKTERVVVIGDMAGQRASFQALGAVWQSVPKETSVDAATAAACRGLRRRGRRGPTAVMRPWLPSLESDELDDALDQVRGKHHYALVEDLYAGDTTLLASATGFLQPTSGPGSAAAHRASGALDIGRDLHGLRWLVDSPNHLRATGVPARAGTVHRVGDGIEG